MESLKSAHYKEVIRARFQLDNLQKDKSKYPGNVNQVISRRAFYKRNLQFEKDGSKANPLQLQDITSTDAEAIGKYLIRLSTKWKTLSEEAGTMQIGNLYGFDLFIRRQRETNEEKGMFEYHYRNIFYAEGKETGIKYSWNQGILILITQNLLQGIFKCHRQGREFERKVSKTIERTGTKHPHDTADHSQAF